MPEQHSKTRFYKKYKGREERQGKRENRARDKKDEHKVKLSWSGANHRRNKSESTKGEKVSKAPFADHTVGVRFPLYV